MTYRTYTLAALMLCLASCTINDGSNIRDQVARGVAGDPNALRSFVSRKAYYEKTNVFGEEGYSIMLFDEDVDCKRANPPISFDIPGLSKGTYKGSGPFFYYYKDADNYGTASFFGCDVLITDVTATTVEGKVKGGDPELQHIEGRFSATLCE